MKFQAPAPDFIIISVACAGFTVKNLIGGFMALILNRDKNFNF